jgi:hypothetical protein
MIIMMMMDSCLMAMPTKLARFEADVGRRITHPLVGTEVVDNVMRRWRTRVTAVTDAFLGMEWYGAPPTPWTAIVATKWWQLDRAPAEHAQTESLLLSPYFATN